jgi:DNA-binding transcriptional MerR regulator
LEKAPDAFRTISEVADELDVPQHVLRFWESRFPQIRPMKRAGGRRYYRPEDVDLLRGIRHLLYGEGYTIRGVQRILREQGPRFVQSVWQPGAAQPVLQPEEDASAEPEQLPPDEAARTIFGLLKSPLNNPVSVAPPESGDEDDETGDGADAPRVVVASVGGLTREDVRRLQSALQELGECRRLLEDAVKDEAA